MKITIINGNNSADNTPLDTYVHELSDRLKQLSHEVCVFDIYKMDIKPCTGCWSCWWKTPGLCAIPDDTTKIFTEYMKSDLVLMASPIVVGFISAQLKKFIDRSVILLHPYITVINGESRHLKRYQSCPACAALLQKKPTDEQEDIDVIAAYMARMTHHLYSPYRFTRLTDVPPEEVVDEINNL